MSKIGGYIAIFGIASIILSFFNYNLRILMWIDSWGETTGWIIRIGLIVVGAVLFFMGGGSSEEDAQEVNKKPVIKMIKIFFIKKGVSFMTN